MAYSKSFNAQTLIVCYGNFAKKQNSDCVDIMTCDNWVFKMGKTDKNFDFTEIFLFSISNFFVEPLVTHIKLYIFWRNSLSSTQKCEINSFSHQIKSPKAGPMPVFNFGK